MTRSTNNRIQLVLAFAGIVLLVCWLGGRFPRLVSDPGGSVRLVICGVMSLVLLLRGRDDVVKTSNQHSLVIGLGLAGGMASVVGLLVPIHTVEWIGVLLLLYACIASASPDALRRTAPAALFVLFWIHPLPGQVAWPIQGLMQRISLRGSEWLLHCVDVAVWTNDLVIHGVRGSYEVPRACSGMRAASTVFACAMGAGVFLGLPFSRTVLFVALGLVQTLALNIARISIMVAHTAPGEVAAERLHDTTGVFLLIAILLIQAEMAFYGRHLHRQNESHQGAKGLISIGSVACGLAIAASVMLGGIVLFTKQDSAHRAALFMRVSRAPIHANIEVASGASRAAVALEPENVEYRASRARMLIDQGDANGALNVLEALPDSAGKPEYVALRLQALLMLARVDDARRILDSLDPRVVASPAVAMTRAELAMHEGDIDGVVSNLANVKAVGRLAPRVRSFFPLLASHEQWMSIYHADAFTPYADAEHLLLGVSACLVADDIDRAGKLMASNVLLWEQDVRFGDLVFALASQQPHGPWKQHYCDLVIHQLPEMHADSIPAFVEKLQALDDRTTVRKLFAHLKQHDPTHPGLWLLSARYVALRSEDAMGTERELLEQALESFASRRASGDLSQDGLLLYADALVTADKRQEAMDILDSVANEKGGSRNHALLRRVGMLAQTGDWGATYESLRAIRRSGELSWRVTDVPFATALLESGHPMAAAEVARHGLKIMPKWQEMSVLLARILAATGQTEEALFQFQIHKAAPSESMAKLLRDTGRFAAERRMLDVLGRQVMPVAQNPSWALPPAERVVTPPSASSGGETSPSKTVGSSPFLTALRRRINAVRQAGDVEQVEIEAWRAIGRDPLERAGSLHAAALLRIEKGNVTAASQCVDAALSELPDSVALHRLAVRLCSGRAGVVSRAVTACPEDPELWLARLVVACRAGQQDTLKALVAAACVGVRFSPGALTRGAEYLLRHDRPGLAETVIQHAIAQDDEYVPAYLVGLHCARVQKNLDAAIARANKAAQFAPDPRPFEKQVVRLTMLRNGGNAATCTQLEALRRAFPKEAEWPLRLGCLYMDGDDAERAWHVFAPLCADARIASLDPSVVTRIAEAARRTEHLVEAISLLRQAHQQSPENVHVLNNLIYTLNGNDVTRQEALSLVSCLLAIDDSVASLDTASLVYNRVGKHEQALAVISKAMSKLPDDPVDRWAEVYVTAAEARAGAGDMAGAAQLVETLVARVPRARMNPRVRRLKIENP